MRTGGGGYGKFQESPARVRRGGGGVLLGHGSWHRTGGGSQEQVKSTSTTVDSEELRAPRGQVSAGVVSPSVCFRVQTSW